MKLILLNINNTTLSNITEYASSSMRMKNTIHTALINSGYSGYHTRLSKENIDPLEISLNNNSESTIFILTILGILCNLLQPLIYLAPIKCFIKMIKENDTEKTPFFYFLLNIFQCIVWIIISTKKFDLAILIANVISASFFFIFFLGFLIISSGFNLEKIMIRVNLSFIGSISLIFCLYKFVDYKYCAIMAVFIESSCYLSILEHITDVFRYKDCSYIDKYIVLSIFIVNSCWSLYSLIELNWVLFIPNFIGVIISGIVLYIYNYFKKIQDKKQEFKSF